jgi:CubicO group peptidase (beta-lactamase class C family)
VYKYGSAHQVIAAAMIEVASGQSFETLYETLVKNPLGLLAQYKNPTLISGSLHSSVADYSKFVRAVYHDGAGDHATAILSKAAVTAQEASQMPPGVVYRGTPQPGLEYGLNTWRWCYQPLAAATLLALDGTAIQAALDPSCAAVHQQGHGGKGGYQPFIDRARGIYGVFSMREPSPGGDATYTTAETNMTTTARLYAGLVADELHGVAP